MINLDLFAARHVVSHVTRYATADVIDAIQAIYSSAHATSDDIMAAAAVHKALVLSGGFNLSLLYHDTVI